MSHGVPKPAHKLSPDVQRAWDVILPRLVARGIDILPIDAVALELLCSSYVDYREMADFIAENGMRQENGDLYPHVEMAATFREQVRRRAAEFLLISDERISVALLDDDGFDSEVRRWFE